jgi:hypothetical protein
LRDANGNDVGVVASEIPLAARDVAAARIMRVVFTSTLVALIICVGLLFFVTRPLFRLFGARSESRVDSRAATSTSKPVRYRTTRSATSTRRSPR